MAKQFSVLIVFAAFLLVVLISLAYFRLPLFQLRQEFSDGYVAEVSTTHEAGQSFASNYPGLAEISVRPTDPATLDDNQIVVLRIGRRGYEPPTILTLSKRIKEIRNGEWLTFAFDPLDGSRSQVYDFHISTVGEPPIRLMAHHADMYPEGELSGGGDLVFQVGYDGAILPTMSAFISRLAEHKPGVWGQPWFFVLLFGGYVLALGATALEMIRSFSGKSKPEPLNSPEPLA
jgi:hypothetical protein